METVKSLKLYQSAPVFAISDGQGKLLLTKAHPSKYGTELSSQKTIQIALNGQDAHSFWGTEDKALEPLFLLPKSKNRILFQIFILPISFQERVVGTMIVGFPLSQKIIQEIKEISLSEIIFLSMNKVYASSQEMDPKLILNKLKGQKELIKFSQNDQQYLGLEIIFQNSLNQKAAAALVYLSKTQELNFYKELKNLINIIGFFATLLAILLALLLSRSVSKAILLLKSGFEKVKEGDLDFEMNIKTGDEFELASNSFNDMTRGLKEKEAIKNTFKRYVDGKIVDSLLDNIDDIKLGGKQIHASIYFSDIAGFTNLSEKLSPEETIKFLNQYLSIMTEIIEEKGGIVDKYIGDAIMAYWPTEDSSHPDKRALETAIAQRKALNRLKLEWKDDPNFSDFNMRIGLHFGEVIMGNVGSHSRMDYTIIGDTVNLSARLESINKSYGTQIMASEVMCKNFENQFLLRELDRIKVVGKQVPVKIYEVINSSDSASDLILQTIDYFSDAYKLYQTGDFLSAEKSFARILQFHPRDKASKLFQSRCQEFIKTPPQNWDGVYQMKKK